MTGTTAPALRPSSGLLSEDAWHRSSFHGTALEPGGVVLLAWDDLATPEVAAGPAPVPAGLAVDRHCRLYRGRPVRGTVTRTLWAAVDPRVRRPMTDEVDLFATPPAADLGEFVASSAPPSTLDDPGSLAVDDRDRLFIAERGRRRVLVFDLERRRLVRTVRFACAETGADPQPPVPVDLTTDGARVHALLVADDGAASVAALDGAPTAAPSRLPSLPGTPSRLTIDPRGGFRLLLDAGTVDARVVRLTGSEAASTLAVADGGFAVPGASDLAFLADGTMVVARAPGADFLRLRPATPGAPRLVLAPLKARGYDGRGIAVDRDDQVVFWTDRGPRQAVPARRRYRRRGRVVTFRLDAGAFQTAWGRVFVDACLPRGTSVRLRAVAFDEPPAAPPLVRQAPANQPGPTEPLPHADHTPPLPPALLKLDDDIETPAAQRLHRRAEGRELPWSQAVPSPEGAARAGAYVTYEAPVLASPGRYLWLALELRGDGRATPRVRRLRIERPGHDLLRRLPRAYAREPAAADFLRRYLAPLEGVLADLDNRAACRHALLDPHAVPSALLPWLASFVGLVLDERWPEVATRTALAEAVWLFRFRGTVPGLRRLLEIYLGRSVVVVEHFRMRGLGGGFVGGELADGNAAPDALRSRAVLGAGFRVGGAVGDTDGPGDPEATVDALTGQPAPDGFATHAHRFTVVVPMTLDAEQRPVVDHILERHRPAHTLVQVCTIDAGMRVGVGLYVALTSLIGRTGGFGRLRLGASTLGRRDLLGRAAEAGSTGGARLGYDTRIG